MKTNILENLLTEEELLPAEHEGELPLDGGVEAGAEDVLHQLRIIQLQGQPHGLIQNISSMLYSIHNNNKSQSAPGERGGYDYLEAGTVQQPGRKG